MISSGTKRGLAAAAVSALAVAGIPALASSADAATGDSITVVSTGPALNGGSEGAVLVLRVKNNTVDPADLALTSTTGSAVDSQNTADQSVAIDHGYDDIIDDPTDANFDIITTHIDVTTSADGATAAFRVFDNDGAVAAALEASEARASVSVATAGPLASIDVAPASQTVAQGQTSGAYTATLKDSAGRTTQLETTETVGLTSDGDVSVSDATLDSDELATGSTRFTATAAGGAALGNHDITLTSDTSPVVTKKATLVVTAAADLDESEIDIVTGADSWTGFGGGTLGGTTYVRVDQSSVRIDFKSADVSDRNSTVTLNVAGNGITFGGKPSTTVTTVLDGTGAGSVTITPDAFSVQEGDSISITGSFSQTLDFQRTAATTISAPGYIGKLGGSVPVTVTVKDQFGNPVTTGFVGATDTSGPNASPTQKAAAVDANGQATLTFTDTKATASGQTDTIGFGYVPDQFTPPADAWPLGGTTIKWTTDGMGANFNTLLDGNDTGAPTYKATDTSVVPLADADDNGGDDDASITVNGGEPNAKVTLSVDNGALILAPGDWALSDGKASATATLDGAGNLAGGYRVIGTKSGVSTLTIAAANRTETAQFTVAAETDISTARNVTVSGPATVASGTPQITYTAVVTDAFGNPVVGFPRSIIGTDLLNVQVSGPAQYKDGDTQTDANGALKLNVAVDPGATGSVGIQVKGVDSTIIFGGFDQFGAAADRLSSQSTTDDAKGLPVSSDLATATTTIDAPPVVTPVSIGLKLSDAGSTGTNDKIKANANSTAAGLKAVVYKNGKKVASHALNGSGDFTFKVKDTNGKNKTKYTVKVAATATTNAASKSITIK